VPHSFTDDTTRTWDIDIPLATNPFILKDMVLAVGAGGLGFGGLVALLFAAQGDLDEVAGMLPVLALILPGICLFLLLVMIVWFLNRFPARFTVDQRGAAFQSRARSRYASRALVVGGLVTGRAAPVGAGLIGLSGESQRIGWQDVHKLTEHPRWHVVTLSNRWRPVLRLYCLADNYAEVVHACRSRVASASVIGHRRGTRLPR
jgi:hypothetical protein